MNRELRMFRGVKITNLVILNFELVFLNAFIILYIQQFSRLMQIVIKTCTVVEFKLVFVENI